MTNNSFSFFAPAYLVKSGTPSPNNPVRVGGVITTTDRDIDGEIISKSSDFSYFENGFGKIKYEHTDYKEPYSFIGSPLKLIRKGTQTHFIGELYPFDPNKEKQDTPQKELAKAAYGLLQEIEDHNRRHPESLQKAGWSIEGDILEKNNKTGLVKARVVNVVLTTKPRNMKTYAQTMKSLSVGYGMNPATQTGFGAVREESLDGDRNKSHFHKGKGVKIMKTKKMVYDEAIEAGKTPEEATKLANEFEAEKEKSFGEDFVKSEKSLGNAKDKLTKSIETSKEVLGIDVASDVALHKSNLTKSLKNEIGEEVDYGKFFLEQAKMNADTLEMVDAISRKVDLVAKSIITRNEADIERIESDSSLQGMIYDTRAKVAGVKKGIELYFGKLAKSTGLTTLTEEQLSKLSIEDNNNVVDDSPMSKNDYLKSLDILAEEGKVEKSLPARFESNAGLFAPDFILTPNEMQLVKSKHLELSK